MLGTLSLLTACVPFKKLENESDIHNKIGGSWTVMHDGHRKIENITPPAFIEFNENNNISGFDGCNKFSGTYRMDYGVLKASIKSSRMACNNSIVKEVSNNMHFLLKNGARVVSIDFMGAKAIQLANKDNNVELRFGRTEQLNKDKNN
ncbi:META domain-containing protein [Aeromonas sobria]|nr:META domain-containing protein [Aeromonas sobria]MBS4689624.1 META domain-containing protein [Aeromonas sobria]